MATFALAAIAADISGTWKGTAETTVGKVERTFVFQVNGNKLTGETTSNVFGKSTIADGDAFTVTIRYQGNEGKARYKGKVGDEINSASKSPPQARPSNTPSSASPDWKRINR
jgi:hypothetical protein